MCTYSFPFGYIEETFIITAIQGIDRKEDAALKRWSLRIILRIESRFWSFNEGMNGITDAHIVWRGRLMKV